MLLINSSKTGPNQETGKEASEERGVVWWECVEAIRKRNETKTKMN